MTDQDDILVALRRISRAIDLNSKRLMKETGLTAPQHFILKLLEQQGPLAPTVIARTLWLSQGTITSILDRLQSAGLVERSRSAADKRILLAGLTKKGEAAAAKAPELLQAEFLHRLQDLAEWERHMLVASLQRIAELMDAESLEASPILASGEIEEN